MRLLPAHLSTLTVWIIAATVIGVTAAVAYAATERETPADDSAAAGFLRDMTAHHRQAVDMGLIMFARSDDPAIRTLALDILTTQQAQIGMTQGWLQAWDLSQTRAGSPMEWMGHPMDGLMPGMATDEDLQRLRDLPPDDAGILFLQLMIPYHAAGVDMAQGLLDRSDEPLTVGLAEKIIASQQAEIRTMRQVLEERGAQTQPTQSDVATPHAMDMGN